MLEHGIRLTADQILNKDFKTSFRGYNPDDVDQFLDMIMKDYEQFESAIEELEKENLRLKKAQRRGDESEKPAQRTAPQAQPTNYDILKRLSHLEKKVFGSKLYE